MPQQNRQTAYKVKISDLINGRFVKEGGWEPNYVLVDDLHVSRVNLMCIVVSKEFNENYGNVVVDDGSAKISVRSFDEKINFDNLEVGDVILLIARLREFNNERYLTPEIIKKVENKKWIELRKLELKQNTGNNTAELKQKEEKVNEKNIIENSVDGVLNIIRRLDDGEGANFEDVANQTKDEKIISELLMQGEIFEPKPGKLKVLE